MRRKYLTGMMSCQTIVVIVNDAQTVRFEQFNESFELFFCFSGTVEQIDQQLIDLNRAARVNCTRP